MRYFGFQAGNGSLLSTRSNQEGQKMEIRLPNEGKRGTAEADTEPRGHERLSKDRGSVQLFLCC